MRLLQVCNVGQICGGTAACAWTITHALGNWDHHVAFLSRPDAATQRAFSGCQLISQQQLSELSQQSSRFDLALLHNIAPGRVPPLHAPTLQYQHSVGQRQATDWHVTCSRWLAEQCQSPLPVLYQPVPVPPFPEQYRSSPLCRSEKLKLPAEGAFENAEHLQAVRLACRSREERQWWIVGRICTPTLQKWPQALLPFYERLSSRFPEVLWEFVGTPNCLHADLRQACRDRVRFYPAGFEQRQLYWRWDHLLYHHPTLTESFGRTVAEAMRAGCFPCVDARGGFPEQIEAPQTGNLCRSLDDFAASLADWRQSSSREELAFAAHLQATERFSLRAFHQQLQTCLSAESFC